MNESFKFHIILLIFTQKILAILFATRSNGESSTCVTVYEEGGAPAIFQSPKCPHWTLSNYNSHCHHHHHQNLKHRSLPIGDTLCPRYSHPISWSFSLWVFVVNCINTILFSIYWRNSPEYFHLFPFRPILVSCSEFSMAKDFFLRV